MSRLPPHAEQHLVERTMDVTEKLEDACSSDYAERLGLVRHFATRDVRELQTGIGSSSLRRLPPKGLTSPPLPATC